MNRRNENSRNGNSPSKNDKRNGIGIGSLKNETNGRRSDEACPNTNELHAADGCSSGVDTDQDHHQQVLDRRTALHGKKRHHKTHHCDRGTGKKNVSASAGGLELWYNSYTKVRFHFDQRKSKRLRAKSDRGIGFEEAQEIFISSLLP